MHGEYSTICTLSPLCPQSNGFIKRMVQNLDSYLALLAHRSTPLTHVCRHPQNFLFTRQIGGTLPSKIKDTSPRSADINNDFLINKKSRKHYYYKRTKELPTLQANTKVTVQDTRSGMWTPITVVQQSCDPKSYMVQLGNERF